MSAYSVGIDLGTTHTVVACVPVGFRAGINADDAIELFAVEQLVAAGEMAALPLLPSLRYHPAPGELAADELALPWAPEGGGDAVIGELARRLGAGTPGRLVASAKSWLSHGGVDRLAPILPWGAAADVPKVSPVMASASYLGHVRAAWNHRHPAAPLERQEVVLTVPASFDDAARTLTLEAARAAGLPSLRLLEEPQAALYDWLFRHRQTLGAELAHTQLVLVCDVGGGTTDLSLVRIEVESGEPRFERVAVGSHLMLGGDNMDLALARLAESRLAGGSGQRLTAGQWSQLLERCRAAKEQLLAGDAPERATVTLLGAGSRLVGGASSAELARDEVERIVVDGFFPQTAADDLPQRGRGSALVAFGLPYASDAAVTRHIAAFLRRHADAGVPDALLLNGGVFRADAIARRLQATLAGWRGAPLQLLRNADPDVAVARGAVAYALARRGLAPRIGGGSPRSYFLQVGDAATPTPGSEGRRGVCVLPRGSEEGREIMLDGRSFVLRVGEPVRFHLLSTTAETSRRGGVPLAGEVIDLDEAQAEPLPPLATVVPAGADAAAADRRRQREIPVRLAALLTEVGTLELHCIAEGDTERRWRLEFELRTEPAEAAAVPLPGIATRRLGDAVEAIDRVFGARDRAVGPKETKQLRSRLEVLLGSREHWPTELLRTLFDALWPRARGRHRSADHERLWLSLAGWCLRPGFGDALDGWRIERLWTIFEAGVQHGRQPQVNAEWWTLWRRVAGGLDEASQRRLLDDFALNLRGNEAGAGERPPRLVKGGWDDMVRLGASLERIDAENKVEIGDWLLGRLQPAASPGASAPPLAPSQRAWTLWAIGRLGARAPLYGSAHAVVPTATAVAWIEELLRLDWAVTDGAAAATANLARLSGDRARDLPAGLREHVAARLVAAQAPAPWIERVREVVPLDETARRGVFGESLPPGLRLIG